jgi:hypothetical protein
MRIERRRTNAAMTSNHREIRAAVSMDGGSVKRSCLNR